MTAQIIAYVLYIIGSLCFMAGSVVSLLSLTGRM
jgi:hypothetical protein